jgi:hypothetical protein
MPHSILGERANGLISHRLFAQFLEPWVTLRSERTVNSRKCS